MSIPVLGGPEIKLGIRCCHIYSRRPPPLSRCYLHREGRDAATAAQGHAVWGPALCTQLPVLRQDLCGEWEQELFRSSLPAPGTTLLPALSVPSSTARFVHQNCLQPRLPYGSHGRIILVHSVFCGHQSVPLHLPSTFLSLLTPGSHCCSKNLVKMASPRATQPMQILLLSSRNKEMFPA